MSTQHLPLSLQMGLGMAGAEPPAQCLFFPHVWPVFPTSLGETPWVEVANMQAAVSMRTLPTERVEWEPHIRSFSRHCWACRGEQDIILANSWQTR